MKCTDLTYLTEHTRGNQELIKQMIKLYMDQTIPLNRIIQQSSLDKDWPTLYSAVHKMIPSFSIMGIDKKFEDIAKRIQEYASTQQSLDEIKSLVLQLNEVCSQSCEELQVEYNLI